MKGWKEPLRDGRKEGGYLKTSCRVPERSELWVRGKNEGIKKWERGGKNRRR